MVFLRAWNWFTLRWPFHSLKHLLLDEEIPGGASFAYTIGASILAIFTLQAASGIIQLFYYVPAVDHAYDSVSYLRTEVPFGWLVHNIHYWGANIMVILVALHMIRVYVWGGYKTQLTWVIGVGLLVTTMAFTFTGAPLIWDQRGYWAGEVGSSITGTVPVMGGIMKMILRGGEAMGQLALSRFFVIHIGILMPFLLLLIGMHVAAFRTTGVVGPWDEGKRRIKGLFWPDQAFKDIITATVVIFILITLSVFIPPSFSGPADPSNTTYLPKPEWNFLFLYQALKYFKGPFEPIGTAGVPTVLIALLVLLPFIDRNEERNPMLRPLAMISLAVYAGIIITLTIIGYLSPGYAQMPAAVKTLSQTGSAQQANLTGEEQAGAKLFESTGCIACHMVNGKGGAVGPALTGKTLKGLDKKWLTDQIMDPKSHFPKTIMPSFSKLPEQDIKELVDYLLSIEGSSEKTPQKDNISQSPIKKEAAASGDRDPSPSESSIEPTVKLPGRAAYIIGDAENGGILFKENCASCHGQKGTDGVSNPGSTDTKVPPLGPIDTELFSSDPKAFAGNIDAYIQHGSVPEGTNPALRMPAWGDTHSLTQQEIANLEAYIMKLNGVDRAKLINPGMQPRHFFFLTVFVFGTVALILGGIWNKKFRQCD